MIGGDRIKNTRISIKNRQTFPSGQLVFVRPDNLLFMFSFL